MQFVFCFQLQLHERGMKIHEIIYEQVTETFIFTETCQNIENPEVLLSFTVVVVRVSDKASQDKCLGGRIIKK